MRKSAYANGLIMTDFKHIPQISCYNNNYYNGFGRDLLFGESDDDNITEWFLVENQGFTFLGESYTSDGDKLYSYNKN